jgi:hypothetical protein
MRRVLFNHVRRDELVKMGQVQAGKFSWDDAAAALLAIFEEAVTSTKAARLA